MKTNQYVTVINANIAENAGEQSSQSTELIETAQFAGAQWYNAQVPNNSLGKNGDYLIITEAIDGTGYTNGDLYRKENGIWFFQNFNISGAKLTTFKDIKNISANAYTLLESDWNPILQFTSNNLQDTVVTIPLGLPANIRFEIRRMGASKVTLVGASGVTLRYPPEELPNLDKIYTTAAIEWTSNNQYIVYGHLEVL
ncbi:gp102 [Sphingomonas phage PAU]|uniref:gp102 n=1 Tax=Sphingomonas phage PAU TaxID=1150991 RepID=UPI0002573259|nr:gp102 [Sphingomonas phage PAU]AFF28100.1 gp102 [Sphingomonas phage PAU]